MNTFLFHIGFYNYNNGTGAWKGGISMGSYRSLGCYRSLGGYMRLGGAGIWEGQAGTKGRDIGG